MKKGWILVGAVLIISVSWYIGSAVLSRDTLDAFTTLNENVEKANTETNSRMDSLSSQLKDTDFAELATKVEILDSASLRLENYIESIKSKLLTNLDDPNDYEGMDQSRALDALFFEGNTISKKGNEFLSEIRLFEQTVSEAFVNEFPDIVKDMQQTFNTADAQNRDGEQINWLVYHYQGFPLIASLTRLTQLQVDIKNIRQSFLEKILAAG